MKSILFCIALTIVLSCVHQARALPHNLAKLNKVFNYQNSLPVKDDRTGEVMNVTESINGVNDQEMEEAEAACWNLINEKSVVTFALQKRVLADLAKEMENSTMDKDLREMVEKLSKSLSENLDDAIEALKRDNVDEFFDALFETSEGIIHMSIVLRDPKVDDTTFLMLAKAVSRLGRNNAALIQEFSQMCSFIQRAPRPRSPKTV